MTADLSYAQLEGVWDAAAAGTPYAGGNPSPVSWYPWDALMAAIAEAESSGNPGAENPTDDGGKQTSWGLWQISLGTHAEPAPNWNQPSENAALAIGKLESQGLSAWGTYDSGAYARFLQSGTPAQASATLDSSPYSNVEWWNPLSWVNVPGDAATQATQDAASEFVHYGAIVLAVLAGLGLVVLGAARATRAPQRAEAVIQPVAEAAAAGAAAA